MGGNSSKSDKVDSNGQINNNVIIDEDIQFKNEEMIKLLYVIAAILLFLFIGKMWKEINAQARRRVQQDIAMNV